MGKAARNRKFAALALEIKNKPTTEHDATVKGIKRKLKRNKNFVY